MQSPSKVASASSGPVISAVWKASGDLHEGAIAEEQLEDCPAEEEPSETDERAVVSGETEEHEAGTGTEAGAEASPNR